jgi:hypothetical protein
MAVATTNWTSRPGGTTVPPAYYLCDTAAERPSAVEGDLAYAKDVDKLYYYTSSWVEAGGSLPSNIAYTNVANTFTQNQTINKDTPALDLYNTTSAVDSRRWRILALGLLSISAYNDAGTTELSAPLICYRNGQVDIANQLKVSGPLTVYSDAVVNGSIKSGYPIYPGTYGTNAVQSSWLIVGHPSYGLWSNTGLYLSGGLTVAAGGSFGGAITFAAGVWHTTGADGWQRLHFTSGGPSYLKGASVVFRNSSDTDIGSINANGDFTCSGNIGCTGNTWRSNIHTIGYVYPGNMSTGVSQTSYYIASNSTYGMYINTGLYLVGGIYIGNTGWYWSTWGSGFATNVSVKSAGWFYPGNREDYYYAADAGGLYTNTTFEARGGYIRCGYYMYPGAITNPGVVQTSWYLAGHSSYGLYINTGLYVEYDLWCNQVQARGFVFSPGYRCRNGSSGAYGGNCFNINWTGAVPLYIDNSLIGNIAFSSDARIKRDFTPLVNSLEKVLQMRPGTFYYRQVAEQVDPDLHLGLLAQDVLPIAPEVVRNTGMVTPLTPDGMFQISYVEMIPMLVAAIQELEQRVSKLSGGINGNIHD